MVPVLAALEEALAEVRAVAVAVRRLAAVRAEAQVELEGLAAVVAAPPVAKPAALRPSRERRAPSV